MSKEGRIIGMRVTDDEFKRFEALANADDRKIGSYAKRVLLRQLPILEAEAKAAALNEPPAKYAVPGRSRLPKGKSGTEQKDRN